MFLRLENIGKICSADIELKGITVIAGENNTGKSTVGKILYSVFNSFYHFETTIQNTRFNLLAREIENSFVEYAGSEWEISASAVANTLSSSKYSDISIDTMRTILSNNIYSLFAHPSMYDEGDDEMEEIITLEDDYVESVISLYKKYQDIPDDTIYLNVFNQRIRNEFYSQINNVYTKTDEGKITLTVKDKDVVISVKGNKACSVSNTLSLKTEVLYLDDPFILDQLNSFGFNFRGAARKSDSRKRHLADKLINGKVSSEIEEAFKELIINEQISEILEKINSVCEGSLARSQDGFVYAPTNNGRGLNVGNISLGLKTFIIIKTLLINGSLEKNGTIILDEPEIHLHPQWQLLFAEIIVLLQKEFGLHVLLTTHSPYFLEAIEVYSEKYKISDKCKFYLADNSGKVSNLVDVTGDTEQIYKKLASPFQTLENERYRDD